MTCPEDGKAASSLQNLDVSCPRRPGAALSFRVSGRSVPRMEGHKEVC